MSSTRKIAIVTGISSGIGRATATGLAARGVAVIGTYRGNPTGAEETVSAIETAGGEAFALPLDVGDSAAFAGFAERVGREIGERWQRDTVDALVNNAGFAEAAPFADTTEDLFDRLVDVTLKGPYFLTQHLLPLLADGGAVVNVTSSSSRPSGLTPGYSAYGTVKGGLAVLTRYMAKELSPRGIRVNAVSPGATRTRLGDDGFARHPEVIPAIVAETALGRLGEAEDVGDVIVSLVSDECRWVTAQEIEVSGGARL